MIQSRRFLMGGVFALAVAATTPAFAHPGSAIVVDRLGQVWFLDTGAGLWKVGTDGTLVHIGGNRFHWMAQDPGNRLAGATLPRDVTRVDENPGLLIASDFPIAMGRDGNLYYPSAARGRPLRIMRATAGGPATVLATLPATTAVGTPLEWLNGMAGGPDGSVYFAESHSIRRVTRQGRVEAVIRNLRVPGCVRIPGNEAIEGPFLRGLDVDPDGAVYVAASGCGSVLKVAPNGQVTRLVQLEAPWSPTAVALHGRDLYVLEYLHTEVEDRQAWVPRIRKLSPDGSSVVIARVERLSRTAGASGTAGASEDSPGIWPLESQPQR